MSGLQRTRWPQVALATALGCSVVWFVTRSDDEGDAATKPVAANPQEDVSETREPAPVEQRPQPTIIHEGRAIAVPPQATRADFVEPTIDAPAEVAAQSLNVVGPGPHDPHLPGMVPHPLDEERARIATENRLLQGLNDAMSYRKVKEMREMLVELREVDPEDVDKHQLGYEVIADCIEFPGGASLTAAKEFYEAQRHSPLRRFVRRICFQDEN